MTQYPTDLECDYRSSEFLYTLWLFLGEKPAPVCVSESQNISVFLCMFEFVLLVCIFHVSVV